jgi:site-specific recombinase XerD
LITERKTKKRSSKVISAELRERLLEQAGNIYIFQGRDDYRKHRTRQAVFTDLKKAAKRFNIKLSLSPHSLRKNYAVYLRKQGKTIEEIQQELNHDNTATTMIYVFSDELHNKYRA